MKFDRIPTNHPSIFRCMLLLLVSGRVKTFSFPFWVGYGVILRWVGYLQYLHSAHMKNTRVKLTNTSLAGRWTPGSWRCRNPIDPRKVQHTPRAHPVRQSPGNANYEKNPDLWPVGKSLGVCSSSVCWNNLRIEQLGHDENKNHRGDPKNPKKPPQKPGGFFWGP